MENLITQIRALGIGVVTLVAALTLVTLGVMSWTNVQAAVQNTPHNLSGAVGPTQGPGPNTYPNTAEICVFCHTPHGGSDTAEVPLWNRATPNPGYITYATLNSATMEAAEAPVGSVSIACLSCHDGTQAMDTLLNEPGSGAVVVGFSGGTWNGADRPQGIANLDIDLTNDHPIGIQYGGGGIQEGAQANATPNDPDFNLTETDVLNTTPVWWVDTGTVGIGTREKTDMLLYTRSVAGIDGGARQPFVECASCHDPHSETPLFMRTSNDGSAVCLACHNK